MSVTDVLGEKKNQGKCFTVHKTIWRDIGAIFKGAIMSLLILGNKNDFRRKRITANGIMRCDVNMRGARLRKQGNMIGRGVFHNVQNAVKDAGEIIMCW